MFRNLISLFLVLTLMSVVDKSYAYQKEEYIKPKVFEINLPEGWRSFVDHNYKSYTPYKNRKKQFYSYASLYRVEFDNKPKSILDYIERIRLNNRRFIKDITEKIYSLESKFGKTYIYVYESIWKNKIRKSHIVIFKFRDEFYCFTYSSNKDEFHRYLDEAQFIFENLKVAKDLKIDLPNIQKL